MSIEWHITVERIETGEKVQHGSARISQEELDQARGRDVLIVQFHAGKLYSKIKEAVDEREDQA